jgi:hypothetical protein
MSGLPTTHQLASLLHNRELDSRAIMNDINLDNLADAYLRNYREKWRVDQWAFEKVNDLIGSNVDRAWEITSLLLSKADPGRELSYVASGPLEDFLGIYKEKAINRMEQGAKGGGQLQLAINRVWRSPNDRSKHSRGMI